MSAVTSRAPSAGGYTPAEDAFLREHYAQRGRQWCADELNRTPGSIKNRVARLKLTTPKQPRHKPKRNDRGITFSKLDHAPLSIEGLGKPREYPRVKPLGKPCHKHPTNTVGAWGKCPACAAGERWAARQRETVMRPHHEGGR